MHFTYGATRFVILYGDKSIKIGRIRPLRTLSKIVSLTFSERKRILFKEEYGENFLLALFRFMIVGVWANRNEYFYHKNYRDNRVMPTLSIFLGGLISIQERGFPVSERVWRRNNPVEKDVIRIERSDLRKAHQYCICRDGAIRVVDYGSKVTCEALALSLKT